MFSELKKWLKGNQKRLCAATLQRAPNMLLDEQDLAIFFDLLNRSVGESKQDQLTAVQAWTLDHITPEAHTAHDWQVIIRVLKEELSRSLGADFSVEDALNYWWSLDNQLTNALIEVTHLVSDDGRQDLLSHMVQLRRQMERLEQSKSNFITVAAHELRTPLTILEGYANMLRVETEPDSRLRVYISGLENGLLRMNDIIGDMIDVSLLNLQSFDLKYQQINLSKQVQMITEQLNRHFIPRGVTLKFIPFDNAYYTYVDPTMLAKALNKVLMNALKFTPDGGQVTVSGVVTRQEEANDSMAGYIDLQIQDSGIGIDPENLDRIFQTFGTISDVSLHSSGKTKFKGGGAGLGLSITKGIVEAHGGRIWAQSTGYDEKKYPGTTFHLEIPLWRQRPESILG